MLCMGRVSHVVTSPVGGHWVEGKKVRGKGEEVEVEGQFCVSRGEFFVRKSIFS